MNIHCLFGHKWSGCVCTCCGLIRNQEHDWKFCRCRRCGLHRKTDHLLEGCVCVICHGQFHIWHNGVCTVCKMMCNHDQMVEEEEPLTAHYTSTQKCNVCGIILPPKINTFSE